MNRRLTSGEHRRSLGHTIRIDIGNADKPSLAGEIAADFATEARSSSGNENGFPTFSHSPTLLICSGVSTANVRAGQALLADIMRRSYFRGDEHSPICLLLAAAFRCGNGTCARRGRSDIL